MLTTKFQVIWLINNEVIKEKDFEKNPFISHLSIDQICWKKYHIQWYLLIRTPLDSDTSQSEHIWRINFDLQSKFGLSIWTQKHVAADPTFPPVGRSCLHVFAMNTSLLQLGNGFQVTPAPSCLGYSSPQPWSLSTYHRSQCSLLLWSLANLFTNEDIFNTLNNQWRINC